VSSSRYVVVGAGLAGAATAWSLARRGHEVTVVERTQPAARDGSSHGSARIFRYAYPDPFYAGLVVRAREGFDELERLSGQQLITPCGALDFGPLRDPRALARVLDAVGVEHELLSAAEARTRWPQIAVDSETLWHPGAGVIDAEGTVRALLAQAEQQGAQVLTDWPVTEVAARNGGYRLSSTDGRTLDAERVVVTAGGWLPALLDRLPLPASFRALLPPLQVSQENAFHFPYREEDCDRSGHDASAPRSARGGRPAPDQSTPWPTFIHKSTEIPTYGLPGGRDAGFRGQKIAEFLGGRRIASAADQDGVVDPANRARVVDYVRQYLPGLVPEPYAETTCLFTSTPTEDFVVDGVDGITLVSPCSGHGAKFAPLIGDVTADVATGTGRAPDRFTVRVLAAS
jgi:sarcosine oxidase